MAQPTTIEVNGVPASEGIENGLPVVSAKRKRDDEDVEMNGVDVEEDAHDDDLDDEQEDQKPTKPNAVIVGDQKQLVRAYYQVLSR